MTRYEWDELKNHTNCSDHGVDFETAQQVFNDPLFITFVESVKVGEERWHAIGIVDRLVLLVVVHTYRAEGNGEVVRIISCRRAGSHERKLYEEV